MGMARPGGRTARNRTAVRDATLAELAEHGYPGLTVEAVAERSGVHKTTVYRRWGGVDGLIIDALDLAGEDDWRPPDTGSLDDDLRALAHEVHDTFADPATGAAPAAFIAAAFHSERAAGALHAFFAERHRRATVVVTAAMARGEAPDGTDGGAVVRAAIGPLYYRLFIAGEPVDRAVADQSAAAAACAARAGVFAAAGR